MRLYLAHPFDLRHEMREWEQGFEERTGIELHNPFYEGNRSDVEEIDAGRAERYEKLDPQTLVDRDLDAIDRSDGIVAYIGNALSYGTIMEIVHAWYAGATIYLVVTNGHEEHPWLRYHATEIFTSLGDFEDFIAKKAGGVNT